MSQFVDVTAADDPRLPEITARLAGLTQADLGREVARFRGWPAGRVTGTALTLDVAGSGLALLSPVGVPWGLVFVVNLVVLGLYLPFLLLLGAFDKHRVCEHGLALGYRRRTRLIIPWESIDPGRVHVLHRGWALGRQLDSAIPFTHRSAGIPVRGLVVNGLNSVSYDPMFVNWVIGLPQPGRLAAAIEAAMIADGFPAAGLAANAERTAITLRWRPDRPALTERRPLDPLIGLPT